MELEGTSAAVTVRDRLAQEATRRDEVAEPLIASFRTQYGPSGTLAPTFGSPWILDDAPKRLVDQANAYILYAVQASQPQELPYHSANSGAVEVFAPSLLHHTPRALSGTGLSDASISGWMRGLLHLSIYADVVWVPDPLDVLVHDFFLQGCQRLAIHEPVITASFESVMGALDSLQVLKPLFAQGILRFYPPISLFKAQVESYLFANGLNASGCGDTERFVLEGLSYARLLGAAYTPLNPTELGTLHQASAELSKVLGTRDQHVVRMLPYMKLPYFRALSAETAASIRLNDASFEAFRSKFRLLLSDFTGGYSDPDFFRHLREFENDRVKPVFEALAEEVSHSKSLSSALGDAGVSVAAGALGTTLATSVLDEKALLAGAISGVATMMLKILRNQSKASPAAMTVYHLTSTNPASRPLW